MGESSTRLGLLGLNTDVFALIFETISNSADLSALCLTSHVLHELTLPYLYRKIEINGPEKLLSCEKARMHFSHTKSLTVLDTPEAIVPHIPLEASIETEGDPLRRETVGNHGGKRNDTRPEYPIDAAMLSRFLRLFHDARLSTFRFTSEAAGLDASCWTELAHHFGTLQHLHVNLDEWSTGALPKLQTMDIRTYGSLNSFPSESDFESFLKENFSKRNSTVKNLHLEIAPRYFRMSRVENHFRQVDAFKKLCFGNEISLTHLENLTALSLCRLPLDIPQNMQASSYWLPNVCHLKKLSILRCHGERDFLVALGKACMASPSSLEHLQVQIYWEAGESSNQDVDWCLELLYRNCDELKSLHIGWIGPPGDVERLPGTTLANLRQKGRIIRSFSLHNHPWYDTSEGYGRYKPIFKESRVLLYAFKDCPNLEELAFVASDSLATEDSESSWEHWKEIRVGYKYCMVKNMPIPLPKGIHLLWAIGQHYFSAFLKKATYVLHSKDLNISRNSEFFIFVNRPDWSTRLAANSDLNIP